MRPGHRTIINSSPEYKLQKNRTTKEIGFGFFNEIVNSVDVGLSLINTQMEIIWANKMAESYFGPAGQLLGKKCYRCFGQNNAICIGCPAKKAFSDKNPHIREIMTSFTINGDKRYYRVTATPILNNRGEADKVLESIIDITEKRQKETQSRKHAVEMRKLTAEIIRVNEIFKKLAKKRSSKLRLANKELKNIYEFGNTLITSLDVNEVMRSIVNIVPKLLKVSGCIVRIVDETKTKLILEAAYGVSDKFQREAYLIPIGEGISGRVAKICQPISIPDLLRDKRVKYQSECFRENIRGVLAAPILFKGKLLGVLIAFSKQTKHFKKGEINLLSMFAAHAAIALNNAILHNRVHINYYNTMITLVKAMEARDPYTCGHSERVTSYAVKMAKKLNLTDEDIKLLMYAGKLHDIGKIAIPDFILKKTTALTSTERAQIEAHPIKGIEMIMRLKFLEKSFPLIRHHHERYDGKGYPDKLKGEKIPLLARILAIVDAFDAMTSERPYRKGLTIERAINEIKRNFEAQFDPQLAKIFLSILQEEPNGKIANETSLQLLKLAS